MSLNVYPPLKGSIEVNASVSVSLTEELEIQSNRGD